MRVLVRNPRSCDSRERRGASPLLTICNLVCAPATPPRPARQSPHAVRRLVKRSRSTCILARRPGLTVWPHGQKPHHSNPWS